MGIFEKFKLGFKKSANKISEGFREIVVKKEIDDKKLDEGCRESCLYRPAFVPRCTCGP